MAINTMTSDPYIILGIPQDAAPPAIRSSYKKLILQCHPDKVHDESLRAEKAVQFQRVQEAYELLIDSRRRRKHDDEVKKAAAGASKSAGGSGGGHSSSEERHRDRDRDREREREKERGHGRSSRRREEDRRTRDEPSSRHPEDPRGSPRKSSSYRHQHPEPATSRSYEGHSHYPEEQPLRESRESRHKYSQRYPEESPRKAYPEESPRKGYPEESPRKATYGPSPSHHSHKEPTHDIPRKPPLSTHDIPRGPPLSARDIPRHSPPQSARDIPRSAESQPQSTEEAVRPGYLDALAAEKAKLEGIRRKLTEETSGGMTEEMKQAAIVEKLREKARLEKEKRKCEMMEEEAKRERAELRERSREASGSGRSTDIPPGRERKSSSKSPPMMRRGSSTTASKVGEDIPSTPMNRPAYMYGSSAPQRPTHTAPYPLDPNSSHAPRRRHSTPSIEKQTQHMQREVPCDSGYSSPSTDTPLNDKKVPSPGAVRTATEVHEGFDHSGNWRRFTFEVYVREDEAPAPGVMPQGPIPHQTVPLPHQTSPLPHQTSPIPHKYRQAQGSTSPSLHPNEPIIGGHSLPPEFIQKVTGMPYYASSNVDSRFGSPPSNHPHSPHSPHSTPPRPHVRHHHSHHSPNHSPKLGSETFVPPGVTRSHTTYHHSRRTGLDPRDPHYPGYPPNLPRGSTFS